MVGAFEDWFGAALDSHIPYRGEPAIRYPSEIVSLHKGRLQ
jgi:hypothetical protein